VIALSRSISAGLQANDFDPAPRLLLIEDFADARETITELLESLGYRVTAVSCGGEACDVRSRPDVIVSDIGLPDCSGFELLLRLHQREGWSGIPAIAISGFNEPEHLTRAEQAGFLRYLVKPVCVQDLNRVLQGVLSRA
jgi:CheY-like chemotaxis protein